MCFSKKLIIVIILIFLLVLLLNNRKEHKKSGITFPILPIETSTSSKKLNDGNLCNFDYECNSNKCKDKYCRS